MQVCVAEEQSSEEVASGIILTWDSALRCKDAPLSGEYTFDVQVTAAVTNTEVASLQAVTLTHTTPRLFDQGPDASVDLVTGLPFTITAGQMQTFTVVGVYELAASGAAKLANLHFCATGIDAATHQPFYLGLNAFLRGPGMDDDDNGALPTLPPVIGPVQVTPGLPGSVRIDWQTDVPATSEVIFYPSGSPGLQQTVNRGCLTAESHQIAVSGLLPATDYTYKVRSRTGVDSVASSAALTFTTPNFFRAFLPLIIKH